MASRTSPATIGAFVTGAVVLLVVGLVAFGGGAFFQDHMTLVAHFQSSVAGLDIGAPVRYRGIRVGTVSDIRAVWTEDREEIRIPVTFNLLRNAVRAPGGDEAELENLDPQFLLDRMIQRGLRAELAQESFVTGKLYVALDFFPDTPIQRVGGTTLLEMPTTDTQLDKLKKSVQELPIQELVESMVSTLDSIDALASNPRIGRILDDVDTLLVRVDDELGPLVTSLRDALGETSNAMRGVENEVRAVTAELHAVLSKVDAEIAPLAASARGTLDGASAALEGVAPVIGADSLVLLQLAETLEELSRAATSVRQLADLLERQPEALVTGR